MVIVLKHALGTGAIIAVIDQFQASGLGSVSSVKFEALGWDFGNNNLVGNDDDNEIIAQLTLLEGNNVKYGDTNSLSLTDVEGTDFVPTPDGEPDTDGDGLPDVDEAIGDQNGDGLPDLPHPINNPNDTHNNYTNASDVDGDGILNSEDSDSDNDGLPDSNDPSPYIFNSAD